jgi:hypothetical protein
MVISFNLNYTNMLHARQDYNHIQDPSGKIPADEPVFLLRGQDVIAPTLLRMWAKEGENIGVPVEMRQMVLDHANLMEQWQRDHFCKVPDLKK